MTGFRVCTRDRCTRYFLASAGSQWRRNLNERGGRMLWTIIVILLILWLLGAFVRPVGGGLIHLLLVIVLVLAILQFV